MTIIPNHSGRVAGVSVPEDIVTATLAPDAHEQFRKASPGALTRWTKSFNPGSFTGALEADPRHATDYIGHFYQDIHLRGYGLDHAGGVCRIRDPRHRMVASAKAVRMRQKFFGMRFETGKIALNLFDPTRGIQRTSSTTFFRTPLGTFLLGACELARGGGRETVKTGVSFIPYFIEGLRDFMPKPFENGANDFHFNDGDWRFDAAFEGSRLRLDVARGDFSIHGVFKPMGEGHGDIVTDADGNVRRARDIRWHAAETLTLNDNGAVFHVAPEKVTSLTDRAQGFTPKPHSWDWATFCGRTPDGGSLKIIFEGVRSRSAGAGEQDGWVALTARDASDNVTEKRLAGRVRYDYDPENLSCPWKVTFDDGQGNAFALKAAPAGKRAESHGGRLPGLFKARHERLIAGARLTAHSRELAALRLAELNLLGFSSLESAEIRRR